MIAFRYTKTDGAEYLSHLDLLRHIDRTLRRAKITVNLSQGFNKHPLIYLNNPLGLGIKSVAEYGAVDCDFTGDFAEAFNKNSPAGIKCTAFKIIDKNPNYANAIESCRYEISGISPFEPQILLQKSEIVITDKRGRQVDIRPRIKELFYDGDRLVAILKCGTENLRPDLFCEFLANEFGGKATDLVKTASFGDNVF